MLIKIRYCLGIFLIISGLFACSKKENNCCLFPQHPVKDRGLIEYGKRDYAPDINKEKDILLGQSEINPFITIDKKGNGIIAWKNKNDRNIYTTNINNFETDLKSIKQSDKTNIDDFKNQENKNLSFKSPENAISKPVIEADLYGNGYVTYINKDNSLVLKLLNDNKFNDSEIIVSKNLPVDYSISLEPYGYGLLTYIQDKNMYVETINAYSSIKKEKINLNDRIILNSYVKLNEKGNGIIARVDYFNNLYVRKVIIDEKSP